MSHYTCAVITDGTKTVAELMAPYQENNMGDVPDEYLEFNDVTDSYINEYENDSLTFYREPNKLRLLWGLDDKFKNHDLLAKQKYLVPSEWTEVTIPRNIVYPTFEEYMIDFCGYEPIDGRYGYWENPNARWDWYVEYESPCWVDERIGRVPIRLVDLQFDSEKHKAKAIEYWNKYELSDSAVDKLDHFFETRDMSKEQYIEASSHLSFWACVTPDGKWHEMAEMGWFGMADTNPDGVYDWEVHFKERYIDTCDQSCMLHVLDCHI